MSTIVFQGLQSCIEPQMVETRTLRFKVSSQNSDLGNWSFPQFLSNSPQIPKENETSYVHPMAKKSYSKLSNQSLDLCTENLGSETGSDTTESAVFSLSSMELEEEENNGREESKSRECLDFRKTKTKNSQSFPPPLTSMSGSNSLQVRPHREGGRLVIEAVETPSRDAYLQAERSHGRLRLTFMTDFSSNDFDPEIESFENEVGETEELENEENYENQEEVCEEKEGEFEEDDDEEEERKLYWNGDIEGNSLEVGVEMGIEKFQRPSRCYERGPGNKGLCNWKLLCLATS